MFKRAPAPVKAEPLLTKRLMLIPASATLVRMELEDREAFARKLGVPLPLEWPPPLVDEAALRWVLERLEAHPEHAGWYMWYWIRQNDADGGRELIGSGGFKGPPSAEGEVEIGYSVLTKWQRQGYGTEIVRRLVAWAFEHKAVRKIVAETLAELLGSIGVLEATGFQNVGEGGEPGVIRFVLTPTTAEPQ